MGDDALPPIVTPPITGQIDPLLDRLSWSKADLGRFFGVSRTQASQWAHGHTKISEPVKALFRYLKHAAGVEAASVEASEGTSRGKTAQRKIKRRREGTLRLFGEAAHEAGVRGLIFARFGQAGRREDLPDRLLNPDEIKDIRERLGWIQAEMAAFFGVTHSTPGKWEAPDPGLSPAAQAGMIALREWSFRPGADPEEIRTLWETGLSAFLTETVQWNAGVLADR